MPTAAVEPFAHRPLTPTEGAGSFDLSTPPRGAPTPRLPRRRSLRPRPRSMTFDFSSPISCRAPFDLRAPDSSNPDPRPPTPSILELPDRLPSNPSPSTPSAPTPSVLHSSTFRCPLRAPIPNPCPPLRAFPKGAASLAKSTPTGRVDHLAHHAPATSPSTLRRPPFDYHHSTPSPSIPYRRTHRTLAADTSPLTDTTPLDLSPLIPCHRSLAVDSFDSLATDPFAPPTSPRPRGRPLPRFPLWNHLPLTLHPSTPIATPSRPESYQPPQPLHPVEVPALSPSFIVVPAAPTPSLPRAPMSSIIDLSSIPIPRSVDPSTFSNPTIPAPIPPTWDVPTPRSPIIMTHHRN